MGPTVRHLMLNATMHGKGAITARDELSFYLSTVFFHMIQSNMHKKFNSGNL